MTNKATEELKKVLKRFESMSDEEFDKLYTEAEKRMEEFSNFDNGEITMSNESRKLIEPNNYSLILDTDKLNEFIDWLPELKPNEQYYLTLFFRKKYYPIIKSDKGQLKRVTSTKDFIIRKIQQMECKYGSYEISGTSLPNEGLALYITPNPRDLELATKNSLITFAQKITKKYDGYNPQSEVMSEIQKSCSRKIFMDFDFDNIEFENIRGRIESAVNINACSVIKTKGGFHLLIRMEKIEPKYNKSWYRDIMNIDGVDVRGDNLLPVVGCRQGDFVPYFIIKN